MSENIGIGLERAEITESIGNGLEKAENVRNIGIRLGGKYGT